MTPVVGDWIRFRHGGQLVIDRVEFIHPRSPWDSTPVAITQQHGEVGYDSILEIRGLDCHNPRDGKAVCACGVARGGGTEERR